MNTTVAFLHQKGQLANMVATDGSEGRIQELIIFENNGWVIGLYR